MPYRILTFLLFIILNSCVTPSVEKKESSTTPKTFFVSKGFTLVYTGDLYKEKLINGIAQLRLKLQIYLFSLNILAKTKKNLKIG